MNQTQFSFTVTQQSKTSKARLGVLKTPHGDIETPVFMPVGTLGSVKAMLPEMLLNEGAQIILANTYHLYLRPGVEVLDSFGGLHEFMNWHKPILTDSGGFQVFSLGQLNKVTDHSVIFRSHLDGSLIELTPEKVIQIQQSIGADIIMPLDECLPPDVSKDVVAKSIKRTTSWERRCLEQHLNKPGIHKQALFAIIQGGMYEDLREESAKDLVALDFFGYAIGGLSVGEGKDSMYRLIQSTVDHIPQTKPRYLMGVGEPVDLEYAISQGIDMFDCVLPTRLARHGAFFSKVDGMEVTSSIKKKEYEFDKTPLDVNCNCYTCRSYSKAYLRHLWRNKELSAMTLMSIHNVSYLMQLVKAVKKKILQESKP